MSFLWGQPFLAAVATYIAIYGPTRAVFYFGWLT